MGIERDVADFARPGVRAAINAAVGENDASADSGGEGQVKQRQLARPAP